MTFNPRMREIIPKRPYYVITNKYSQYLFVVSKLKGKVHKRASLEYVSDVSFWFSSEFWNINLFDLYHFNFMQLSYYNYAYVCSATSNW